MLNMMDQHLTILVSSKNNGGECTMYMTYDGTEYSCNSCEECSTDKTGNSTTPEIVDCSSIHSSLVTACEENNTTEEEEVNFAEKCFQEDLNPIEGNSDIKLEGSGSRNPTIVSAGTSINTSIGGVAWLLSAAAAAAAAAVCSP